MSQAIYIVQSYIVQSMIKVECNIIGNLTRARRTGLIRFYDIHIRVERVAFRGTRSFLREYRIIRDTSAG